MVWYDPPASPTAGILIPKGIYRIESEDSEYRYFRAPGMIGYRSLRDGKVTSDYSLAGGLFLSKHASAALPAGVYSAANEQTNVLIWKLGRDFMKTEGERWSRNF